MSISIYHRSEPLVYAVISHHVGGSYGDGIACPDIAARDLRAVILTFSTDIYSKNLCETTDPASNRRFALFYDDIHLESTGTFTVLFSKYLQKIPFVLTLARCYHTQ